MNGDSRQDLWAVRPVHETCVPARLAHATPLSKRALDIAGASVLVVLGAPLMVGIACLMAAQLHGNPFLAQRRVGYLGKPFALYKFRTMFGGAHELRPQLALSSGRSSRPFKLEDDPRVTPAGRFLRRWSLDELPQVFNVLKGNMSLVGPRPLFVEDIEAVLSEDPGFHAWVEERQRMPPGLTGLWQVSGRSTLSTHDLVRLDMEYVRGWTFRRDLRILARTPQAVISRIGAF